MDRRGDPDHDAGHPAERHRAHRRALQRPAYCFNFNHAESAATAEQVAHLAKLFREVLAEITEYTPTELPTAALSAPE